MNDRLLTEGFRFWILAVLDHAEIQPQDRGLSVLLLPANYYSLSRVEKEKLILQSYINGHFYCSGLNTFHLKSFSATDSFIDAEFSEKVDVIKIITNKEETSYSDLSSIKFFIKPGTNYIRVEAHKNNNDFLFTQPVFYD